LVWNSRKIVAHLAVSFRSRSRSFFTVSISSCVLEVPDRAETIPEGVKFLEKDLFVGEGGPAPEGSGVFERMLLYETPREWEGRLAVNNPPAARPVV
jgi:hypothetical protein